MKPLSIWTNQHFPDALAADLERRIAPHMIQWARTKNESVLTPAGPDPAAREAEVLWGQPSRDDILASERLKWVQLTSAGYTRYDDPAFLQALRDRGVAFCNGSSVYEEPCAQHAMAMLMSLARGLPHAMIDQPRHLWETAAHRKRCFLLDRQKVLIVGYGAIARRLVELMAPYPFDIFAFRRSVRGDENVKTLPIDRFDEHLSTAEIIVNILPASGSTKHFFNAARLAAVKPGAIYISIGRGDTTDQNALIAALTSGKIARAYLDVTTPEPLPPGNALWTTPNCYITPHTAGGTVDEPIRLIAAFLANLKRFEKGETLVNRL